MLFGSNILFIEGSQIWGSLKNSLMSLGVRKKMYQIK